MTDSKGKPGIKDAEENFDFEIQFYESLMQREKRDPRLVEILGHLYTRAGRIDDGLKMDRKMVRLKPEDPLAHYNLACSLALKNRKKDAVASLHAAVEHGYTDYDWLRKDEDLSSLHDYGPFLDLLATLK